MLSRIVRPTSLLTTAAQCYALKQNINNCSELTTPVVVPQVKQQQRLQKHSFTPSRLFGLFSSRLLMKAVGVKEGVEKTPDCLFIQDSVPKPSIQRPVDVLIKVEYTCVNRADIMQRKGFYPPPAGASPVIGLECCGEVVEVGADVKKVKVGDKVTALVTGGGYAQYNCVHEGSVMPVVPGLELQENAAIPEVYLTAFQCLWLQGGLQPGHNVLIHAGASGVGLAAVQLAKAAGAVEIITTCSKSKIPLCKEAGATFCIARDEKVDDTVFSAEVQKYFEQKDTPNKGANVVIDPVFGGGYLQEDIASLAVDGTVVIIGFMGGSKLDVDAKAFFKKRARIVFSALRSQTEEYKANLVSKFTEFAHPKFADKTIKPNIHKVMPWTDIVEAHKCVESNESAGKVVLKID